VLQLAHALTKKWAVAWQARFRMENLESAVECRTVELVRANQQLEAEVERRAALEKELRDSEERFHKSFDAALVALAILEADTLAHTDVNSSFLSLTGRAREEVIGRTPQELGLPAEPADFLEKIQTLRAGKPVQNLEATLRRADNQLRQTLISVVPLRLGERNCLLAALLDITDQRRLDSQLRHSQKMQAVSQLAAGVALDFNNLLTLIVGQASAQLAKASLDKEVGKSLEQVKEAGERASALTRQLLAFSHKQILNRARLDLAGTIGNMRESLARVVGGAIDCRFEMGENVPCVLAEESSIGQVLLNLALNARDAMPRGGKLHVGLETQELHGPAPDRHVEARDGRFVVLTVQDNGCGMDAETQSHLFEPFFTTKPAGNGAGLGLSTVYGIVRQHEGWIEARSRVGEGSTFRVFLPAADGKANDRETAPSQDHAAIAGKVDEHKS